MSWRERMAWSGVSAVLAAVLATGSGVHPAAATPSQPAAVSVADLSYSYRYPLRLPPGPTPAAVTGHVAAELTRYFPFDSDCKSLPPVGTRCELYSIPGLPLWGTTNPVLVVARTETSWSFRSLPGHTEGPGRYITFSFHDDLPGLSLHVNARGPWTPTAAITIHTGTAHLIWHMLATNITTELGP